jgi:hypothetical protein
VEQRNYNQDKEELDVSLSEYNRLVVVVVEKYSSV